MQSRANEINKIFLDANNGNADACFRIAINFYKGLDGFPKDKMHAKKYFLKAALIDKIPNITTHAFIRKIDIELYRDHSYINEIDIAEVEKMIKNKLYSMDALNYHLNVIEREYGESEFEKQLRIQVCADNSTCVELGFDFFENIPIEIILNILIFLDVKNQAQFAQVSKKFNEIENDFSLSLFSYKKTNLNYLVGDLLLSIEKIKGKNETDKLKKLCIRMRNGKKLKYPEVIGSYAEASLNIKNVDLLIDAINEGGIKAGITFLTSQGWKDKENILSFIVESLEAELFDEESKSNSAINLYSRVNKKYQIGELCLVIEDLQESKEMPNLRKTVKSISLKTKEGKNFIIRDTNSPATRIIRIATADSIVSMIEAGHINDLKDIRGFVSFAETLKEEIGKNSIIEITNQQTVRPIESEEIETEVDVKTKDTEPSKNRM